MHGVPGALLRYRIMAYVVGTLLVILVCVGLPLKYFADNESVVLYTAVPHGWLFIVLLITAFDLGRRVHWSWARLILIGLSGIVPFMTFIAEHYACKNVREWLATEGNVEQPQDAAAQIVSEPATESAGLDQSGETTR